MDVASYYTLKVENGRSFEEYQKRVLKGTRKSYFEYFRRGSKGVQLMSIQKRQRGTII
jgi:hypothetical protein